MDERVTNLKTPEHCEIFAKNARAKDRADLADQARMWAIQLRAAAYGAESQTEIEALEAVHAYEETLPKKNGKRARATRIWQMIRRHGIIEAVNRVVARKDDAIGYILLKKKGMEDLSFEAVVLRYPQIFSEEAVSHAEKRISEHD